LQFIYNPNRTYNVIANTTVNTINAIDAGTISVIGQDMLDHAASAGLIYDAKYILNSDKSITKYTIGQVVINATVCPLPLLAWTTGQMQWTGLTYMYEDMPCNYATIDIASMFSKAEAVETYGNMHTFMFESNAMASQSAAYYKFHTATMLDGNNANFDTAFANVMLPTIQQGIVTFRNLTYSFYDGGASTKELDGKKFALVVRNTAGQSGHVGSFELQISSNYCVLICNVDLSGMLSYLKLTNNTERLSISDFYDYRLTELLPQNLASAINIAKLPYNLTCDASLSNIQLQPPYSIQQA
jgi:hypothetical protein